jgi:hypothetical protein
MRVVLAVYEQETMSFRPTLSLQASSELTVELTMLIGISGPLFFRHEQLLASPAIKLEAQSRENKSTAFIGGTP